MKLLLSLFLVTLSGAHAATTETEYWQATGISAPVILSGGNIKGALTNCYKNLKNLSACVQVLNAIGAFAQPPLTLVPANGPQPRLQSLGHLDAVQAVAPVTKGLTNHQLWQRSDDERKALQANLQAALKSEKTNLNRFASLADAWVAQINPDAAKSALLAAAIMNAWLPVAVDPHARVEPIAKFRESMSNADESYVGIGVTLGQIDGNITITDVMPSGGAETAGIRSGDILLEANGISLVGKDFDSAIQILRGEESSSVRVQVRRNGESLAFTVVRRRVVVQNISGKLLQTAQGQAVGYVKLQSFIDEKACVQVEQKLREQERAGARAFIFDLRGNLGGALNQAVCIGSLFSGTEVIVEVRSLGGGNEALRGSGTAATDKPVVVLIDGSSASASEIVSGALQDLGRAWILGERSFGKGSVQTANPIMNGKVLLWQTTARFYQPSGRTNQIVGIFPNFVVPFKPDATEEERFVWREAEAYPEALPSVGGAWVDPRTSEVLALTGCTNNFTHAAQWYSAHRLMGGDYQQEAAKDLVDCIGR